METFVSKVNAKNPSIEIISDYTTSKSKIKCHCLICNNEWETYPSNLIKGHGCPECAKQKRKKKDT
jgi:hypothetical protein